MYTDEQLQRHIKTHTERSDEDVSAVSTLKFFMRSDARINCNFSERDRWPNTDGSFELVPDPDASRKPKQNFIVQIKGTSNASISDDGIVKYQLKSLAFPAYIAKEVSLDPGILFVILNPEKRNEERVFWKYMSATFLTSIDFEKSSATIEFSREDEIENTDASIDALVEKLDHIANSHSYMKQLEGRVFSKKEVVAIIQKRCQNITEAIEIGAVLDYSRDKISSKIQTELNDLCKATLLLNAVRGHEQVTLRVAWETALLDIETKFLATFYIGLRYIGIRVPEEGQYERLLLKYYGFLWKIRKYLEENHNISVLQNLEDFPKGQDAEEEEYNQLIAEAIESVAEQQCRPAQNRYYIQKKVPFFVGKERYFELTLQLADKYATKYNRLTVYSKKDITTNYSIQVGCVEAIVHFWGKPSTIKVVTDWVVSIIPTALNKLAKILRIQTRISTKYNEYHALMQFFTLTGINLLDYIDMRDDRFQSILQRIYDGINAPVYRKVLVALHNNFHKNSKLLGVNTVRHIIIRLREELLEELLPETEDDALRSADVYLSKRCYAFENNPVLYNLPHNKTNGISISRDVIRAVGTQRIKDYLPYIRLKHLIEEKGELFYSRTEIEFEEAGQTVLKYNQMLSQRDRRNGFELKEENELIYIEDYLKNTVFTLQYLLDAAHEGNDGQEQLNANFLQRFDQSEVDSAKTDALRRVFVYSKTFVIYGAAGTGKSTLMNYISTLMDNRSKLFLAKTHTALENLERKITQQGINSSFMVLDSFLNSSKTNRYDVVFVDECSTIDNRTMVRFLEKIERGTLLVLAGDIYQLESIEFGNWFFYAKEVLPNHAVVELDNNWRTQDESLKELWDEVRYIRQWITERLVIDGPFSENIGSGIFKRYDEDEVILCLNYDGKFGLNNMNSYLQDANPSEKVFRWFDWKYKVGDPILFNECKRFPMLYNNLKGTIVDIEDKETSICFTVDVPIILTANDVRETDLERLGGTDKSTRIRFEVFTADETGADGDDNETARMRSIVPFQLAYAVSIHKAQGLEYNSIKVVIPSSMTERITHGVFYTAITRAKKNLKIYWSADTMQQVISSFCSSDIPHVSLDIIKAHLSEN